MANTSNPNPASDFLSESDTRGPLSSYAPNSSSTKRKSLAADELDLIRSRPATPTESRLGWAQSQVYSCPARHRFLVAGRRFGKSHLSIAEAKRVALDPEARPKWVRYMYPEAQIKYFYPTYKQARQTIWEPLKELTKPWWARKCNNSDLQIYMKAKTGYTSTITLVGADKDPDSHRGGGLDLAIFDECAFMSSLNDIRDVIKPSIAERVGRELYITSPNSFNEAYDLYVAIKDGKLGKDAACFQFTSIDGGRIPIEEIEKDKQLWSPRKWEQEYMAVFSSMTTGACYYAFSDTNVLKEPVPYNPQSPVILGLDFNINPLCAVILQKWEPTGYSQSALDPSEANAYSRFYVLDEIYLPNATTYDMLDALRHKTIPWLQKTRGKMQIWLYGDASMASNHTSSRFSDKVIIEKWFAGQDRYVLVDKVPSSNPEVRTRVEAVNSFLLNAQGIRRLFINPQCERLIRDLRQVTWVDDGMGIREDQKNRELTHISSALGYYLHPVSIFQSVSQFF